jgi:hypothetical protein
MVKLCKFLTIAIYGSEWLASCPDHLSPKKSTHVDPLASNYEGTV